MKSKHTLFIIISCYLILGFLYAKFTPPWQIPDEPAHYNFINYITQKNTLPELVPGCYDEAYLNQLKSQKFPPHLSIKAICYEHYQPPLYYLVAVPIFRITDGSLLALRLLSVFFGAITLLLIYKTINIFWPHTIFPWATTAFVAFIPMHLTMLAAVNNDGLAELLFISFIYILLHWLLTAPPHHPLPIVAGLILGLILLTKVTIYTTIPIAAFIIFLKGKQPITWLENSLRVYLPALTIALPFYIRNSLVYGGIDILGLRRHDAVVVGQLRTATLIANNGWLNYFNNLFQTTFHSFWGQFGWMAVPMDSRIYLALNIVQLLAISGLLLWIWHNQALTHKLKQALSVMAFTIAVVASIFIGLNLSFVQFQGRYFFTALMPLGLFFSLGLTQVFKPKYAWLMGGLLMLIVLWVAISSVLSDGNLNKWGVLISGGAVGVFILRPWLPEKATIWFIIAIYSILAILAAVSVWWFIVPNL